MTRTFYEFFAGGGMARLGLGDGWRCLLANDIDPKKMETYRSNFGDEGTVCCDVAELTAKSLPDHPTLAWASFPCQDLSLAGNREGLAGERSGTFWGFWSAINKLRLTGRTPSLLVLENVCGLLTSHGGSDFLEICRAVASLGYAFGAVVVDAIHFLPQSRPRLFIVCALRTLAIPNGLIGDAPNNAWHSQQVVAAARNLPSDLRAGWRWWNLPTADLKPTPLMNLIERDDGKLIWHSRKQTDELLALMSPVNLAKVREAQKGGKLAVGTVYKRTRVESDGRFQRAEVRFDGVAGCLRTPGGGSSRQTLLVVEGKSVRSRLITIREAARLMGVHENYMIPKKYNEGYHIFGDGLAVPAVAHIARHLLDPIADKLSQRSLPRRTLAA